MPSSAWTLFALAIGLAMDATAVAACRGLAAKRARVREGASLALAFGFFQAAMALGGWALGSFFGAWLGAWHHWIACALLIAIGGKMLHEAFTSDGEPANGDALGFVTLLGLSFATSVDAFAAGVTLPALRLPIAASILAIGVVTAVLSAIGFAAGRRVGAAIGARLDLLGGAVLIALGIKILIEQII